MRSLHRLHHLPGLQPPRLAQQPHLRALPPLHAPLHVLVHQARLLGAHRRGPTATCVAAWDLGGICTSGSCAS